MSNRGRHRRNDTTSIPAGARVLTGKSRSAFKNTTYNSPLPIKLENSNTTSPLFDSASSSFRSLKSWLRLDGSKAKNVKTCEIRPDVARARFDAVSQSFSVEVQSGDLENGTLLSRSAPVRLLWECGFFGRGNLSRSEPTWADRTLQARAIKRQQQRGIKILTPEELTALRRKERKAAKIERARLAVRAGQQLPDGIIALGGELTAEDEMAVAQQVRFELESQNQQASSYSESHYGEHIPGLVYLRPKIDSSTSKDGTMQPAQTKEASVLRDEQIEDSGDDINFEDMESLQLSGEEVFFLSAMLGVLEVVDDVGKMLSVEEIFNLLLQRQYATTDFLNDQYAGGWDNPFLVQYVAYHYFRSQGWVVRTGTKFCVDWLLYKKGPAFSHAEFAVVVLPAYEDEIDEAQGASIATTRSRRRDWIWFSSTNRVNTQVLKTLVLCYVLIPKRKEVTSSLSPVDFVKGLQEGNTYKIHTKTVRRFTPQRMRA